MSRLRKRHGTHENESCHICDALVTSCVPRGRVSSHVQECVMSHIRMRHGTSENESCHKCITLSFPACSQGDLRQATKMRHVTYKKEAWDT